jgi:hypothetical protein
VDALLEQVRAPGRAVLEQQQGVLRVAVLAEHDDPGLGRQLVQRLGDANAFIGLARGHPDVGHDDVGAFGFDGRKRCVVVAAGGHDVHLSRPRRGAARAPRG